MDPHITAVAGILPYAFGLFEFLLKLDLGFSNPDHTAQLSVCLTLLTVFPFFYIASFIAERNGAYFEIRTVVGLIGLIICTITLKITYWKADLDKDYQPQTLLPIIALVSQSFYAIFALEACCNDHLTSEVHRKTEMFAVLIIAVASYQELGFDFSDHRPLQPILNLTLGVFLLKLGLLLKVKVLGASCKVEDDKSNKEKFDKAINCV